MADTDISDAKTSALADIARDPRLAPIFDHWQRANAGGALPRPVDFDPTGLPPSVLPYLTILDVVDGGDRFRIRLVGTASAAAAGADHTGRYLDEIMPADLLAASLSRYREAMAHRRPVLAYAEYPLSNRPSIKNLLLALPLSSDGRSVDRLLLVFGPKAEWLVRDSMRDVDVGGLGKPVRSHIIL